MATRVGYHFMSSGIDNWQLALEDAIASNASGHLVLDNLPFADKLARTIPGKVTIVHRKTTLSNDETLRLTPAQAIDYINHPYPVVHQLLNEPGGYHQGQLEWMVAVLKSAPKGLRIGLPAYGTGNPHENDILGGQFDPLIRALGGTDHCLILHEYSQSHNGKNFVPPVPYWVARWTFWQTRARAIGAGNLRFIISEAGRDVGGAMGGAGDGWLNARHPDGSRWTDVDYLRLIKLQAAQYPPTIPLILYCYGRGWSTSQHPEGDWASFDISRAYWLLKELSDYNLTVPLTETPMSTTPVRLPAGTPTFQATVAAPGGPINIRNAPSTGASAVGSILASGRVLTFADVTQYPDWYWVDAGTFSGWINKLKGYPTPLALKEVMVIPTPAPVEGVTLLVSELEDLSYHFSEIAGVFRGRPDVGELASLTIAFEGVRQVIRPTPFKLHWPTEYPTINQPFGARPGYYGQWGLPGHEGLDFKALHGTLIFACADGLVYRVEGNPVSGNYGIHVRIRHRDGFSTIYAHLMMPTVAEGDVVTAGQVIGLADNTGNSSGDHLHLTLKQDGATASGQTKYPNDIIDPTPYLLPFRE